MTTTTTTTPSTMTTSTARPGIYEGTPVILLLKKPEHKHGFMIGPAKAKLIVENFEAIKEFSDANPPKPKTTTTT